MVVRRPLVQLVLSNIAEHEVSAVTREPYRPFGESKAICELRYFGTLSKDLFELRLIANFEGFSGMERNAGDETQS